MDVKKVKSDICGVGKEMKIYVEVGSEKYKGDGKRGSKHVKEGEQG